MLEDGISKSQKNINSCTNSKTFRWHHNVFQKVIPKLNLWALYTNVVF